MDPVTALALFGRLTPFLQRLREGSGHDAGPLLDLLGGGLGGAESTAVDPILMAVAALAEQMPVDPEEAKTYIAGVTQTLTGLAVLRAASGRP